MRETTGTQEDVGFTTKELVSILIERMLTVKTLGDGAPFDVDATLETLYQIEQELQ